MSKITKIKDFTFYFLLFLFPFNARKVFNFKEIKNIEGFREHLSWSLYFFDIAFVLLLILFLIDYFIKKQFQNLSIKKIIWNPLSCFFVLTIISFLFSENPKISAYIIFRLFEAILFFLITKDLFKKNKSVFQNSVIIIFVSGIIQSLVAFLQIVLQKSIGLKILGESVIGKDVLSVAKFEIFGEKFIRGYGTFPHPNILGAFLLLAFVSGFWLLTKNRHKHLNWILVGNIFVFLGIILTYSRNAIFVSCLFLATAIFVNKKRIVEVFERFNLPTKTVAIFLVAIFFFGFLKITTPRICISNCENDKSIELRKVYAQKSLGFIYEKPLLGVGPGNFVEELKKENSSSSAPLTPWEMQPVHNLYLLIATEAGLIALVFFLIFVFTSLFSKNLTASRDKIKKLFFLGFLAFLILGFFDHYFWTLPQGQVIFWLGLAFAVKLKN